MVGAKLKHIIKQSIRPQKAIGVEVLLEEGGLRFHLVELHKNKQAINTAKTSLNLNWQTLEALFDKSLPVHIIINGKGILHKQLPQKFDNEQQTIQAVLPNASATDFCIQTIEQEAASIVSLIRKSQVENLLQEFTEKGIAVNQVSLGSFGIQTIAVALENTLQVCTEKQILHFNEQQKIERWENKQGDQAKEIALGDEQIDSFLLPAYAAAFGYLMEIAQGIQLAPITAAKKEYEQKQVFQFSKQLLAIVFLAVLLINTFFYYHYKNKNQQLQSEMVNVDYQLANIDSLKVKLERQKDLLNHTSVHQNTSTSYYADQIAGSLPEGIQLELLEIFPRKEKKLNRRKTELTKYDKSKITIKGACNSSLIYNKWLKELQAMDWVDQARHINYQDVNNQLSTFELNLTLKTLK